MTRSLCTKTACCNELWPTTVVFPFNTSLSSRLHTLPLFFLFFFLRRNCTFTSKVPNCFVNSFFTPPRRRTLTKPSAASCNKHSSKEDSGLLKGEQQDVAQQEECSFSSWVFCFHLSLSIPLSCLNLFKGFGPFHYVCTHIFSASNMTLLRTSLTMRSILCFQFFYFSLASAYTSLSKVC